MGAMHAQTIAYKIGEKLYLNVTDRCTLQCAFCPKHNDSRRVHEYDLTLEHRPEAQEVISAIGDPSVYREVVFCGYGEPTLRLKLLVQVADYIKSHGGKVRINTDGLGNLVHKRNILPELAGRVDALSVSLNAQNAQVYDRHCHPTLRGSFEAVLDFFKEAPRYVPDVTATAIDGLEGVDIDACRALAEGLGVQFRRRVLDVVG